MSVSSTKFSNFESTDLPQFINSVLSSIDDSSSPAQVSEIRRTSVATAKNLETFPSSTGTKRKAEDDPKGPNVKFSKSSSKSLSEPGLSDSRTSKTPPSVKTKIAEVPSSYKGTSRPDSSTSLTAASKNVPPKKGSFAEVLARAKQNQGAPVGTITHKAKDKLSAKKEIALEKGSATRKPTKGMTGRATDAGKPTDLAIRKAASDKKLGEKAAKRAPYRGTSRPVNKPQTSGYQGTAKAKPQSSYQGTSRVSKIAESSKRAYYSDSEPRPSKLQSSSRHHRKEEDYDEDSDGYDSEDPYTYASEDYSDMDAGFDDVEEEDEMAEKLARKEDSAEQARLDKLKREKDKRKAMSR